MFISGQRGTSLDNHFEACTPLLAPGRPSNLGAIMAFIIREQHNALVLLSGISTDMVWSSFDPNGITCDDLGCACLLNYDVVWFDRKYASA
jgi:hypothetical protein